MAVYQFDVSFPEKLLKIVATVLLRRDFYPEIHQIPFGGRALHGQAGEGRGGRGRGKIPIFAPPTEKSFPRL